MESYNLEVNPCYATSKVNEGHDKQSSVVNKRKLGQLSEAQKKGIGLIVILISFVLVTAAFCIIHLLLQQVLQNEETNLKIQIEASRELYNNKISTISSLKFQIELLNCSFLSIDIGFRTNKPSPSNPYVSCSRLPKSSPSGYYWITSSNGSSIRVYCDMTRTCGSITGGWMRVTSLDMKKTSSECPSNLCPHHTNPNACHICPNFRGSGLYTMYHVGVSYSKVCGRVLGYQSGTPDAYSGRYSNNGDGVFLSYGNPDVNIWAFFAAISERYKLASGVCSCINPNDSSIPIVPMIFGGHYFCDTAYKMETRAPGLVLQDPLWDGAGCEGVNECCSFNKPPWFLRELPAPTSEDIKMTIRLDELEGNEDIAIAKIDIYVQ